MSRRLLPKPSTNPGDERRSLQPLERRVKRNCVANACMPCRKRRSKCDGKVPCASCVSSNRSQCVYDKQSDGRRAGTLKRHINELSEDNNTFNCILGTIRSAPDEYVQPIITRLRSNEDYTDIANFIRDHPFETSEPTTPTTSTQRASSITLSADIEISETSTDYTEYAEGSQFLENSFRGAKGDIAGEYYLLNVQSWTNVTGDTEFIGHLLSLYFTWEHTYYALFSEKIFLEDLVCGRKEFCSELLVNAVLSLACTFSERTEARANPSDRGTRGDHFFAEALRLLDGENMIENISVTVIQALAVMGIREGGYSRDVKGLMYCSLAFRLASERGFCEGMNGDPSNPKVEVRRMTYWGSYCLDLAWSFVLARLPQLEGERTPLPMPLAGDLRGEGGGGSSSSEIHAWSPGSTLFDQNFSQFIILSGIVKDITFAFYAPRQVFTVRKLHELYDRLKAWKVEQPLELQFSPRNRVPHSLWLHMYHRAAVITLFRPFLEVRSDNLVLSPKAVCLETARELLAISEQFRSYHGWQRFPNTVPHFVFTACQTLLLDAQNEADGLVRGVETLLEMRNCWPIAGLMLLMISIFAEKWEVDLPAEVREHLDKLSKDQLRVAMAFSGWPPVRLEEEATWASFRHLSLSDG
ncbi:unnamed protein product [Tuber melanosporum]|uniref:(Perigord truffle) hypothetical protein n=1 Tax=Tuber melanosporum (strain Mel28) TaxID=656061 RepID=D5GFV7_TUBMM|nr:uncharacterized protein GSTUM_00007107001 [Tuber melanosporum]CAZ83400.1 unnamed protein product [Tuber melanosporum]